MPLVTSSGQQSSTREAALRHAAFEGLTLRSSLESWRVMASEYSARSQTLSPRFEDLQMHLADIYYHAISIYLSGIFDHHTVYTDLAITTPTLSQAQIDSHLDAILGGVDATLKHTNLAGVLFLFPLRVAGARAREKRQQETLVGLLKTIAQKGFRVSEAFITDLGELWTEQRRRQ
jgi:Fungal specific transcription factor domain